MCVMYQIISSELMQVALNWHCFTPIQAAPQIEVVSLVSDKDLIQLVRQKHTLYFIAPHEKV